MNSKARGPAAISPSEASHALPSSLIPEYRDQAGHNVASKLTSEQSEPEDPVGNYYYVRLSGLPYTSTDNDVLNFLQVSDVQQQNGKDAVQLFHPKDWNNKSRGLAYIKIGDESVFSRIMEKNNQYLQDRYIKAEEMTSQKVKDLFVKGDGLFYVYVNGFPYKTTGDDILNFLEISPKDVVRMYHPLTQLEDSHGYAFIAVRDEKLMEQALTKHHQHVDGRSSSRYITVLRSDSEALEAKEQENAERRNHHAPILCCRGWDWKCTEDDITKFFDGIKVKPNGIDIILNDRGDNSGVAFVEFENEEDCQKAFKRHRNYMGDRYILLSFANEKRRQTMLTGGIQQDPRFLERQQRIADSIESRGKFATPFKPDPCAVRIYGLPNGVSRREILKFFEDEAGVKPKLLELLTRRIDGYARMIFDTEDQAKTAVQKLNAEAVLKLAQEIELEEDLKL